MARPETPPFKTIARASSLSLKINLGRFLGLYFIGAAFGEQGGE